MKKISLMINKDLQDKIKKLSPEIQKLIFELYETSIRDPKTGLYNHRFFETVLTMEIEKAKRGQENFSLIMIDIDDFKKVNEKYGHIQADEILVRLAKMMSNTIRKYDILSRFGGEEFMILLPETTLKNAKLFSERLRRKIHNDKFLSKKSIKVSGGIAQYKKLETARSFKERTNKALLQAKKLGKDQFISVR